MVDNGIYYFIGNITNHILHALPLYKEIGGTFVVTSDKARISILKSYDVPVINVDNYPYKWMCPGKYPKPIHEYIVLDKKLKKTYEFLNRNAKVILFYELFELEKPEWIAEPKKIFLTHGNMLKSYMTMHPQRLENIKHYDYMAALSPYMKEKFISEGVPKDKLVDVGIARTDNLLKEVADKTAVRQSTTNKLGIDINRPIVLYTPTFWGDSSVEHTGVETLKNISDRYSVLFRPHPQTPRKILRKYKTILRQRGNIKLIDHNTDVTLTQLIVSSDAIIVDRSSIVLEAILADIPLIFAYDTAEVTHTKDYESIIDIVNFSQKITLASTADVDDIIENALRAGIDSALWRKVRQRVWFQPSGGATMAIAQLIRSLTRVSRTKGEW